MTATRWLSAQERECWMALMALSMQLPSLLDTELHRQGRITLFDYHVLAMLSESEGRLLPMSELAGRTNASLSRLSHVVKKLEGRGWVERSQSTDDARVSVAHLRDPGLDMLRGLAPEHVESVRRLVFDGLDEQDIVDLTRIGRKLVGGMDPQHWILR
ncbi:MAG: MarR family winged helix-turn-helix transcriptional regulator [Arthrobacter sp.]|uniref:MarR family winged helix-turn-helix transcriptional regulator n=1 Tax=unclassified Arthrobacter TaxID=235627 RepID=UPI002655E13F|nr:MarR family transcriptional regulator [Micrococcaceae bacterium]MDN5812767.1 MarR family transcriptional regulator [Micrococcaceae bacterium]MDN5824443.1 MarR family transcriptional regulator [Micrococcaceae bacterium]MDN5879106.1 MarR family transcriptional regulator [Micrococcaceae bacterium]MDN5887466.1 MarR family transcriptional regulator [Micrococcaceae bacterium]